jgi:hypothetical protein
MHRLRKIAITGSSAGSERAFASRPFVHRRELRRDFIDPCISSGKVATKEPPEVDPLSSVPSTSFLAVPERGALSRRKRPNSQARPNPTPRIGEPADTPSVRSQADNGNVQAVTHQRRSERAQGIRTVF